MSLSTPPPWRVPSQNHGMCGPLCSSAARARYGGPVSAAPRPGPGGEGSAEPDVEALRAAGATDGEILETNQVCCYFNYVNRSLNGLGVTLAGDVVGYYADDEPEADP